jgi:hypothetical protein
MSLPYDYARCAGTTHVTCQTCQRRTPGHPTRQAYIAPAVSLAGQCDYFIASEPTIVSNRTNPKQ